MQPHELFILPVIGLCAGVLGGLLGIGGSTIIIPALVIVLGPNQHLYQAAAMIVNLFVAIPSTIRHHRAKAVRWNVFRKMIPFGIVLILVGVETSDTLPTRILQQVFGVFLIYVVAVNIHKMIRREDEPLAEHQRSSWFASGTVGGVMGFFAGLLGIGGGAIAVPLLQRICRLPLRQCIGTSAAVICLTSAVGALRKNTTITEHTNVETGLALTMGDSLSIAVLLAPTAIIGSLIGAHLTHALPLRWIRIAFIAVMAWASGKMLGVW